MGCHVGRKGTLLALKPQGDRYMQAVVLRSAVIAVILGLAVTAVASILSATYQESSQAFGAGRVLTGIDAAKAAIQAFGFWRYLEGLGGTFALFFVSIFFGALWQGTWTRGLPK